MKKRSYLLPLMLGLSISLMSQNPAFLVQGQSLKKDSLLLDIALLEKALVDIHPGVYRYNTPESLTQHFADLRAAVKDGMSEAEWMRTLAQTVVKIRCGHTYLNPWNMPRSLRKRLFGGDIYFPLGFRIIEGNFYVTHNASEAADIQRGAEILSINGVETQVIYDSLFTIAKSDGHNSAPAAYYLSLKNFTTYSWQAFDLYHQLFFPMETSQYVVSYRNFGDESIRTEKVSALSKQQREDRIRERYGEEALQTKFWTFEVVNDQLAVVRLGTFAIWNWKDFDYKVWLKDAFHQLDSLQIPNLIVDIRGNGGGLSDPKDELLSYIISRKLTCEEAGKILVSTTRVDTTLIPYIDTWNKAILEGIPEGDYERYDDKWYTLKESGCKDVEPQERRYGGKVFIFGGPSNVSATFDLLYKAQRFGFGQTIGATSGGNKQGINGGDYCFFYLPYSRMEVDIPVKYFAPAATSPDEGVEPDVEISISQEDIATDRDPHLEYVKTLIR